MIELLDISVPKFKLEIAGVGCFAEGAKVESIWGKLLLTNELSRLHSQISRSIRQICEPLRVYKYIPHVKVAYITNERCKVAPL